MSYSTIKLRRGTRYENSVNNILLQEGEIIVEVPDTGVGTGLSKFKIGDGYTRYQDLPYAFDGAAAASINGGSASESSTIQFRSDTAANWKALDPVLAKGEPGYDSDFKWFKIGDGVTTWNELGWMRDVLYDDEDPSVEIVDFGDEDDGTYASMQFAPDIDSIDFGDEDLDADYEVDPYSLGDPSVIFNTRTGETEYTDKILPDGWDDPLEEAEIPESEDNDYEDEG